MGGDVTVRSEWGHGSEFALRLPLREADAPAAPSGDSTRWTARQNRLRGLHVLVAEDNPINQMVLKSARVSEGATIDLVENGRMAVDRVAADTARRIDAVLMDLHMPAKGGLEATRRILAMVPGMPVIGQTADARPEERARRLTGFRRPPATSRGCRVRRSRRTSGSPPTPSPAPHRCRS